MHDTARFDVVRLDGNSVQKIQDIVVVEEPLEIRINNESIGITMRTPGDDFDLAVGLLRTEGMIRSAQEVGAISYCPDEEDPQLRNVLNVSLVHSGKKAETSRKSWANSSCGLCGKAAIADTRHRIQPIRSAAAIASGTLAVLPVRMRARQSNFDRTGGIHAAALFEVSGKLLLIREDLGRHNAVDKVLGAALRGNVATGESVLMVSGRLGFEIAQKALMAGIPIIASVSAPSSLAIELTQELGATAVGFVRDGSMNIYGNSQRVINDVSKPVG
jgi:FdhD protein